MDYILHNATSTSYPEYYNQNTTAYVKGQMDYVLHNASSTSYPEYYNQNTTYVTGEMDYGLHNASSTSYQEYYNQNSTYITSEMDYILHNDSSISYLEYSNPNTKNVTDETVNYNNSTSSYIRAILTVLLRAGYLLIQTGTIPSNNVSLIILQNLLDISIATITYFLIGHVFQHGLSIEGYYNFNEASITSSDIDMSKAVVGWTNVMTTTGIITTMLSGRMHAVGYALLTSLTAVVVVPVAMRATREPHGILRNSTLDDVAVTFHDAGGAGTVHVLAGVAALLGAMFLGRRLLRRRDIDRASMTSSAPATIVLGYLFVVIGFVVISLPTLRNDNARSPNIVGLIVVSNVVGFAGGMLTVVVLRYTFVKDKFYEMIVVRCLEGGVAGIVFISAGVDVYTPLTALVLSTIAGSIFSLAAWGISLSPLEDYCNIIPIHLVCGFVGLLIPQLCVMFQNIDFRYEARMLFGWQVMCSVILFFLYFIFYFPMFTLLTCLRVLRNRDEKTNHMRALAVANRGIRKRGRERLFRCQDSPTVLTPSYDKEYGPYQETQVWQDAKKRSSSRAIAVSRTNKKRVSIYENNFIVNTALVETQIRDNARPYTAPTQKSTEKPTQKSDQKLTQKPARKATKKPIKKVKRRFNYQMLYNAEAPLPSVPTEVFDRGDATKQDNAVDQGGSREGVEKLAQRCFDLGDVDLPETERNKKGIFTITTSKTKLENGARTARSEKKLHNTGAKSKVHKTLVKNYKYSESHLPRRVSNLEAIASSKSSLTLACEMFKASGEKPLFALPGKKYCARVAEVTPNIPGKYCEAPNENYQYVNDLPLDDASDESSYTDEQTVGNVFEDVFC